MRHRYMADRRVDPRVPVLARNYHLDALELDVNLQQERPPGGVQLETCQRSPSGNLF